MVGVGYISPLTKGTTQMKKPTYRMTVLYSPDEIDQIQKAVDKINKGNKNLDFPVVITKAAFVRKASLTLALSILKKN